jgi:hypothetical protein
MAFLKGMAVNSLNRKIRNQLTSGVGHVKRAGPMLGTRQDVVGVWA